ncbi:MAG: NADH-quinone oxidoreductase subunit NuoB [Acidobacteria bacterium]|nr:NADH-quinone oxidoreductase subunit NuoB [Acidobacteriota bacterium]
MISILLSRLRQGHRTLPYPKALPTLPERFRGLPAVNASRCPDGCRTCAEACPTEAIRIEEKGPRIDLGRCLFCPDCVEACPEGAISFTRDHRLSVREREDLHLGPGAELRLAGALEGELMRLFGRSLKLRVVSAGGCNGCEVDVNVLSTVAWDLGRFGIQIVASPRHADGLVVCGPVTRNMEEGLRKTWEAMPEPRIVIAVGSCALSGGPFHHRPEQLGGAAAVVPVDLFIPGCPPHPLTILDGLLRLLGRLEKVGTTSRTL